MALAAVIREQPVMGDNVPLDLTLWGCGHCFKPSVSKPETVPPIQHTNQAKQKVCQDPVSPKSPRTPQGIPPLIIAFSNCPLPKFSKIYRLTEKKNKLKRSSALHLFPVTFDPVLNTHDTSISWVLLHVPWACLYRYRDNYFNRKFKHHSSVSCKCWSQGRS